MNKCPMCPYYVQQTSYGIELIKCDNKECQNRLYDAIKQYDEDIEGRMTNDRMQARDHQRNL